MEREFIWLGVISARLRHQLWPASELARSSVCLCTIQYSPILSPNYNVQFYVYICGRCRCKRSAVRRSRATLCQTNSMACSKTWVVFLDGRFRSIGRTIFFFYPAIVVFENSHAVLYSIAITATVERCAHDRPTIESCLTHEPDQTNIESVDILSGCWSVSADT